MGGKSDIFRGMFNAPDRPQSFVYDEEDQGFEGKLLLQILEGTAQRFLYFQAAADSEGYLPDEFVASGHTLAVHHAGGSTSFRFCSHLFLDLPSRTTIFRIISVFLDISQY